MKRKSFFTLLITVLLVAPFFSMAEIGGSAGGGVGGGAGGGIGGGSSDTVKLANPLGEETTTFCALIKKVLDAAFILGLPIAVLFIVLAGFRFVLARGNPEKLKVARNNLLYVIIGIAIFFGAWLLARVIADTITTLGGENIEACQ